MLIPARFARSSTFLKPAISPTLTVGIFSDFASACRDRYIPVEMVCQNCSACKSVFVVESRRFVRQSSVAGVMIWLPPEIPVLRAAA